MASYKDSVFELASSLTGCSSREPGLLPALPRLDTPERGQRGLEPSKNATRQSRRTGGVWRTHLRTAPGPARPLARPCPGTRGKTLLLSVFHHAHVSHVMLRCLVRDRVKTEINNRINSICVKCRTRVRCSSTLYVSISSASSFKCQHSCGGYYYWS